MTDTLPSKERLECDGLIVTDAGRYVDISFEDQSIAIGGEQEAALRAWLNTRAAHEPRVTLDLLCRVCNEWVNGRRVLDGIAKTVADEVRAILPKSDRTETRGADPGANIDQGQRTDECRGCGWHHTECKCRPSQPPSSEDVRDAERYRWLRKGNDYERIGPMVVLCEADHRKNDHRPFWSLAESALDAAVDKARATATKPGEQS